MSQSPKELHLTPKQLHYLTRIRDLRLARGYSPTMQELADEMGVSKVTVFEHIEALIEKGALRREANKARSLELDPSVELPDEDRNTRIPYVGTIAAGLPIEAVEDRQFLDLEELFQRSGGAGAGGRIPAGKSGARGMSADTPTTFCLKVRGESMIDEHIRDGDYVIVQRRNTARNGETVVALLENGEATLKKYYREKNKVRLQPANDKFEPIIVDADQCAVQGVVIGVVRAY